MKKLILADWAAILLFLLPLTYVAAIYPTLPASVPLHYDAHGTPNNYGSKGTFVMVMLFMQVVGAFTYTLMRNLTKIDPKKQAQYGEAVYQKLGLGVFLFVTSLSIAIIYITQHQGIKIEKILFPLMGLLFAFIGNMMNNIKPNYFAGIRTPWTLEDEGTWRATHRLAAKVWVIGGLIICITSLIFAGKVSAAVFPGAVVVMAFIPIIYSYIYYKKHQSA